MPEVGAGRRGRTPRDGGLGRCPREDTLCLVRSGVTRGQSGGPEARPYSDGTRLDASDRVLHYVFTYLLTS